MAPSTMVRLIGLAANVLLAALLVSPDRGESPDFLKNISSLDGALEGMSPIHDSAEAMLLE